MQKKIFEQLRLKLGQAQKEKVAQRQQDQLEFKKAQEALNTQITTKLEHQRQEILQENDQKAVKLQE